MLSYVSKRSATLPRQLANVPSEQSSNPAHLKWQLSIEHLKSWGPLPGNWENPRGSELGGFGIRPSNAQAILLALHSGITGPWCSAWNQIQVALVPGPESLQPSDMTRFGDSWNLGCSRHIQVLSFDFVMENAGFCFFVFLVFCFFFFAVVLVWFGAIPSCALHYWLGTCGAGDRTRVSFMQGKHPPHVFQLLGVAPLKKSKRA